MSSIFRRDRDHKDDRGTILTFTAFFLLALVATAAVVVDIASARNDRSESQISADAAAAAAGYSLAETDVFDACVAAFEYLEANLGETLVGRDCSTMPAGCSGLTVPVEVTGTAEGLRAAVVYPVDDDHDLMASSAAGGLVTGITAADGDRCERIGVEVRRDRQTFFAGLIGRTGDRTSVHAVARAAQSDSTDRPIHLLLLNRTDCPTIQVNGGGNNGGLFVGAATDPDTGEVHAGFIASDSNGTSGCTSNGVIDANGGHATVRADGPPGCDNELVPGTGQGCGVIEVFGATTTGCVMPACSGGGDVDPPPSRLPQRITRAPIDHQYNCKLVYPSAMDISGCGEAGTSQPYIDQLENELGGLTPPVGYQDYNDAGFPCTVGGKPSTVITVPVGNWWVDCSDLRVQRTLIFEGGNIVLTGDLTVLANGVLRMNESNFESYDWSPGNPFDPHEHSPNAAVLVLQSGQFQKAGGAEMTLQNTAIYTGPTAELDFTGGSGELLWTAPTEGPLRDLAFWSESPAQHKFAGQANLVMDGVFFTPNAEVVFRGNGDAQSIGAQFIANTLELAGNGSLELAPEFDRMVRIASSSTSGLIR